MTHPNDIRTAVVQVRLSKNEKKAAKKRMESHETMSEYIRRLILTDCAKTLLKPKDSPRG